MKVLHSEYIKISRTIVRILKGSGCWGKGNLYFDNLAFGILNREDKKLTYDKKKFEFILERLIQQKIVLKIKKGHGWKYYLNKDKRSKINEIAKEYGTRSIIPLLLNL